MQIEVEAPDGTVVKFPAGTDQETILRVMRENFGGPRQQGIGKGGRFLNPALDDGTALQPQARDARNPLARVRDGVAGFLDDVVQERVLPGGLGEGVIDATAAYGRDLVRAPIQTLSEPFRTMNEAPGNVVRGVGQLTQAGIDAASGDTATARQRLGIGASDLGKGAMGVAEAAALVAPPARGVTRATKAATRRADAGVDAMEQFARAGVDPTVMTLPETEAANRLLQPMAENLGAGVSVRRGIDRSLQQSEAAFERTAESLFPNAGGFSAGRAAREGLEEFRDQRGSLYEDAFSRINLDRGATIAPEAATEVQGLARRFRSDELEELFGSTKAKQFADVLSSGQPISVGDLRELRSTVREAANRRFLMDRDDAALARMDGALTKIMHDAIRTNDGPKALAALKRADAKYRADTTALKTALKPFVRENASPEQIFKSVVNAAKSDRTAVRQLRKALPPRQFDQVTSAVLRDMAYTPEGFSPSRFTREWNKIDGTTKNILFNRQDDEVRKNIDALAFVLARQARTEKFRNFSMSGAAVSNLGTFAAITQAPVTTVGTLLGANAFGELVMRPSFARMLVQMEREIPDMTRKAANLGSDAARAAAEARIRARTLAIIGVAEQSDETLAPALEELRRALTNDNTEAVTAATSAPAR